MLRRVAVPSVRRPYHLRIFESETVMSLIDQAMKANEQFARGTIRSWAGTHSPRSRS